MIKLLKVLFVSLSIAALFLCDSPTSNESDDTDNSQQAANTISFSVNGKAYTATSFGTHGRYDSNFKKEAFGIKCFYESTDTYKYLDLFWGTDTTGAISLNNSIAISFPSTPYGTLIVEFKSPEYLSYKSVSGQCTMTKIYNDPSWGLRGAKGTINNLICVSGSDSVTITNVTFDIRVENGK